MSVHGRTRRGAPLWAALGAPLVGVPLLVGLLALTAPAQEAGIEATEPAARTEVQAVEPVDVELDCTVETVRSS